MKLSDLKPAEYNPRKISRRAAKGLAASLTEFGDLSGIVFNRRTGRLVSGHQRVEQLQRLYGDAEVADGQIEAGGRSFRVRFVDWDPATERAANIAANNRAIAGAFSGEIDSLLAQIEIESPGLFGALELDKALAWEPAAEDLEAVLGQQTGPSDLDRLFGEKLDGTAARERDCLVVAMFRVDDAEAVERKINAAIASGKTRAEVIREAFNGLP